MTPKGCQPKAWRLETLTSWGRTSGHGEAGGPGTWALVLWLRAGPLDLHPGVPVARPLAGSASLPAGVEGRSPLIGPLPSAACGHGAGPRPGTPPCTAGYSASQTGQLRGRRACGTV